MTGQEQSYSKGLEIALQRFADENSRRESLDTKASLVLGFAGVLVGLLANGLPNLAKLQAGSGLSFPLNMLIGIGLLAVVVAVFLALAVLWGRQYRGGPGNKILLHAAEHMDQADLEKKLIHAYADAYQTNWRLNQQKYWQLFAGFVALATGIVFTFIYLIALIWQ
jgi:hypothetical protein